MAKAKSKAVHRDDVPDDVFHAMYKTFCARCGYNKPDVHERYSYGVYAGRYCRACAQSSYRDGCGIGGRQGRASDLDEPLDED